MATRARRLTGIALHDFHGHVQMIFHGVFFSVGLVQAPWHPVGTMSRPKADYSVVVKNHFTGQQLKA
jgi:hypothetical protein